MLADRKSLFYFLSRQKNCVVRRLWVLDPAQFLSQEPEKKRRAKKKNKDPTMARPRLYSGPLRLGEISANAVENRDRLRRLLRKEGDYCLCLCKFWNRRACVCQKCPVCGRMGHSFVQRPIFFLDKMVKNHCRLCDHEALEIMRRDGTAPWIIACLESSAAI